jgi:hypothetical protein
LNCTPCFHDKGQFILLDLDKPIPRSQAIGLLQQTVINGESIDGATIKSDEKIGPVVNEESEERWNYPEHIATHERREINAEDAVCRGLDHLALRVLLQTQENRQGLFSAEVSPVVCLEDNNLGGLVNGGAVCFEQDRTSTEMGNSAASNENDCRSSGDYSEQHFSPAL